MPRLTKILVSCVFIAGCVSGAVAREVFSVPQAHAQGTTRVEHFCFTDTDPDSVPVKLNKAGQQGFELAVTTGVYWCMTRRLP